MKSSVETIIVFGRGGHAKSVLGVLASDPNWIVAGVLDDTPHAAEATHLGYSVLGGREAIPSLLARGVRKVIVAIGNNTARLAVSSDLEQRGLELVNVIHPSAILSKGCSIGAGSFVHALVIVGPDCVVGRNVIIQPYVSLGHESKVGDGSQLSPGCHIGGNVDIGERCFFGPGAVIYPGVRIGRGATIGANTVVNKDVTEGSVVAGNPARAVGTNPA